MTALIAHNIGFSTRYTEAKQSGSKRIPIIIVGGCWNPDLIYRNYKMNIENN